MPGERPTPALRLLIDPLSTSLDTLWRVCASRWTAVGLALAVAFALALGLALPQLPWDAASPSRWLADLQVRQGAWVTWPARLGLLSLHATPGFRLLWGLSAAALLVAVAGALADWREGARAFPRPTLAHLGLLLLLAGALVDERWGWEQAVSLVGTGQGATVGGLYVERAALDEPGGVALSWRAGPDSGQGELRAGWPLLAGLRTLHLQDAGQAVRLRLLDPADRVLPLDDPTLGGRPQPEATLRFREEGESRYLSLPARDWVLRVAYGPADLGGAPFTLWVYRGLEATPLVQTPLDGDGELEVSGVRLRWQLLPYADLRAAFHPGLGLWLGGWLLLCLGLALSLGAERRGAEAPRFRAWIPATLALGAVIWLQAQRLWLAGAAPLAQAGALALAWAAATLLLATVVALLVALGVDGGLFARWPRALGWGLVGWLAGGGLLAVAGCAAEGTLWHWTAAQGWWALVAGLAVAAWHARQRDGWLLVAALAVTAGLATAAVVLGLV